MPVVGALFKSGATENKAQDATEQDASAPSPSGKLLFYVIGAACFIAAAAAFYIMKDILVLGIGIGCGLLFCSIPTYLHLLHEMLGPLKWALYIALFAALSSGLIYAFFRMKLVIHDLAHPESKDKSALTPKVLKGARKKDIK